MIDFWVAVLLTAIISLVTIFADWLASRLIVGARTIRSLRNILRAGLSAEDTISRVKTEIDKYKTAKESSLAWGADLATVAISMDFAALGIWIHSPAMFPFFDKFSADGASREIPVWLIVIGLHLILLITSLVLKHNHADASGGVGVEDASFLSSQWFQKNGWMLASNSTGTVSLLTSIVVFTNAV